VRQGARIAVLVLCAIEIAIALPVVSSGQTPSGDPDAQRRCKLVRREDGKLVKRCKRIAPEGAPPPAAPTPPSQPPPMLAPVPPSEPPPMFAPVPPSEQPFRLPGTEPEPPVPAPAPAPAPATTQPQAPTPAPAPGPVDSLAAANAPPEAAPPRRRRRRRRRVCKNFTLEDGSVVRRCKRLRRRRRPEGAEIALPVPIEDPGHVGEGSRFQGAWRLYFLTDFHDEGTTQAFDLSIFPLHDELRLGVTGEVGFRDIEQEGDVLARFYGQAGYQHPGRVTPFIVANIGGGVIAYERFGINLWTGIFSFGIDGGAELRIGGHVMLGASIGLMRMLFHDAQYDTFTLRVSLGF